MPNKLIRFVYAMNYMAQVAWSFVFPAALFIGPGYLLCEFFHWPDWVMVAAIVLGVVNGIYSMFLYIVRYAKYSTGYTKEKKENNTANKSNKGNKNES